MSERAKEYTNQLILAESDLETNQGTEIKTDLQAVSLFLSTSIYTLILYRNFPSTRCLKALD